MITIEQGYKIVNNINVLGLTEQPISDIFSLLELSDDLYFNDEESLLEDSEYDIIFRYAKNTDPTNAYFLGIGSSIRGGKVNLPFQMGSLDQVFDGEIISWVNKWNLTPLKGVVSDKLDGASAMAIYDTSGKFQIAYSRGDGVQGADISRHLLQMSSVPKAILTQGQPFIVRGENIISIDNFPKIKEVKTRKSGKPYKNARNMVSGLMNASTNPLQAYYFIDFVAYEIVGSELSKNQQLLLLEELGFCVVAHENWRFDNIDDGLLTAHLITRKRWSKYELDGLVIEVESAKKRSEMNPTRSTLNPAFAIKYKITDESNVAYVIVKDIEINISKHGYLKPRVNIEPIDLVGVTVSWATGFNMKFIHDNKIGPGSKIKITRAGDVIPFIMEVIHPMPESDDYYDYDDWFETKIEEFGDVHWTETGVDLVLDNAANNEIAKYGLLVDFFDTIKAPHLGEGNLQKIFDMGFETPESVINLTQEDISSLIGSRIMGKKIFLGLREKLTNIPLYLLMGAHPAFGRGIGVRKMKKLYDAFQGDMSLCESYSHIINVEGFQHKTATKVQNGYSDFINFLREVNKLISIAPYESPKTGNFSEITVVFTGFRDSGLEKRIEAAGGKMGSAVSSKTGLVVTNDPDGKSGKLDKARSLKIQIISIDNLKELLG